MALQSFPVLDVHINNVASVWPSIKFGISTAEFIALDLELSGLGDRKRLASKCLDERYTAIKDAARTRSIISIGISFFRPKQVEETSGVAAGFVIQTYNILALCSQPYIVEPEALKFLTRHGFDFNKQYTAGLPYLTNPAQKKIEKEPSLSSLFYLICSAKKPLILHNGLVDLIFLYENLYLDLPSKLSTFLADVEDLFPAGVYDTKYLAEYHVRTKASYLQYVFRSCLEWNIENNKIAWSFLQPPFSEDVYNVALATRHHIDKGEASSSICQQYASYGWCAKSGDCPKSHDISLIVNTDKTHVKVSKNKKRRLKEKERKKRVRMDNSTTSAEATNTSDSCDDISDSYNGISGSCVFNNCNTEQTIDTLETACHGEGKMEDGNENGQANKTIQSCHRAGVDAFMTGLCYAVFMVQLREKGTDIRELGNKLNLSGKSLPLQITKGNFGKVSQSHSDRCTLLLSLSHG